MPSSLRSFSRLCSTALFVIAPLAPSPHMYAQGGSLDSGAFVTRLGSDTLAVERFVRTPRRVEADVILRVPATLRTRYVLELTSTGELARFESSTIDPRQGGAPVRRQTLVRAGDSLTLETVAGEETRRRTVAADAAVLPFIDMIHWPYEIALVRARARNLLPYDQPLMTGSRVSPFALAAIGADSVTIMHPSRGTMRARVDATGRIIGLDAGETTRKLVVERQRWIDLDPLVERWAALDAAGRSLGALSGRGEEKAAVGGATITVDYGTPSKRGRDIWGKLVPYGEVWRTGANRATHLTTDRDLVLGASAETLVVPAGSYTLFSIPESDGGMLIVSRDTNIAGTAYDPAHDLGRVRLTARPLAEPVETFTIDVAPTAGVRGELRLQWDLGELVVPLAVRE